MYSDGNLLISGPKFCYHLPGHILCSAGRYIINSWWRNGQKKKKKGPQEGISDQKLFDCEHCCISIADEQQRCQRLLWLAQRSSDCLQCHEEALSTEKSSDQTPFVDSVVTDYQPLSRCLKEHVYIS